jgi:hypothetical protein
MGRKLKWIKFIFQILGTVFSGIGNQLFKSPIKSNYSQINGNKRSIIKHNRGLFLITRNKNCKIEGNEFDGKTN